MQSSSDAIDIRGWQCSWEDARQRTLTLGVDATPAQRLAWLEEAILLAHRSGALPKPRRVPDWSEPRSGQASE